MTIALSVVTPVYNAAEHLREFHARMSEAASAVAASYEIIFVNDASTDRSLAILKELYAADPHVVVIDLAENIGQYNALMAGIRQARGDRLFMLDDDLEDRPEWLAEFYQAMEKEKTDIVFSAQTRRYGTLSRRLNGMLFFAFIRIFMGFRGIPNLLTARLITRRAIDAMLKFNSYNTPTCVLCYATGYPYSVLYFEKQYHAKSRYSLAKKIAFAAHYIDSISARSARRRAQARPEPAPIKQLYSRP